MITKYPLLLTLVLIFCACKKKSDPVTNPVLFPQTTYENTCAWDDSGKPVCLLDRDVISPALMTFLNNTLPEGKDLRTTRPELLTTQAIGDITIVQPSDVFITFVFQGTSANNSFAYYTFPTNQPPKSVDDIKKMTYIFPNVKSNTPLLPGDKVKIGRFEGGTSVGFALLQNGWNAVTKKPNNNAVHFCTDDILNPEIDPALKKHAVLINYIPENKVLIGYEDADRTSPGCDHDFNDVIFYATIR